MTVRIAYASVSSHNNPRKHFQWPKFLGDLRHFQKAESSLKPCIEKSSTKKKLLKHYQGSISCSVQSLVNGHNDRGTVRVNLHSR
jgi:hypothetical protein